MLLWFPAMWFWLLCAHSVQPLGKAVHSHLANLQYPTSRVIATAYSSCVNAVTHTQHHSGAKHHSLTRVCERLMQTQRPHGIDFTRNVHYNNQDNVWEQQVKIVQINFSSFQTSIAWSESLRSDHSREPGEVFFNGDVTCLVFSLADETQVDIVGVWHNLHFFNLKLVHMRPISLIPGAIWMQWEYPAEKYISWHHKKRYKYSLGTTSTSTMVPLTIFFSYSIGGLRDDFSISLECLAWKLSPQRDYLCWKGLCSTSLGWANLWEK